MITHFYIDNFKSLVNFELDLAKFTCLIGLNGSGKSTVLQALDFTSALMSGDLNKWLENRDWDVEDLRSNLGNKRDINIGLQIEIEGHLYEWSAAFNLEKLCCTWETLRLNQNKSLILSEKIDNFFLLYGVFHDVFIVNQHLDKTIRTENVSAEILEATGLPSQNLMFQYEGSILAHIKSEFVNKEIIKFKEHLAALMSFDLLSTQILRKQSKKIDKGNIGKKGEQFAAFIHSLSAADKTILLQQLKTYYSQVSLIDTKVLPSGMVQLDIMETYTENGQPQEIRTDARHINDGMLRILAILAEQFSPLETLLFDEIENGINPEVIEKVVDALVASPKQIIVTTHSPMLLNYMSDEVAKESVMLIYKRADGATHATRFFDVPSAAHKLESLPPGSAMLDVYLDQVAQEAEYHHAA